MRTIIAMVFVVMMVICSMAQAFEPPDPTRWYWMGSTDQIGVWIDMQTLKFNKYGNTRYADLWYMLYEAKTDTHSINHNSYDLDNRRIKNLGFVEYNSDGSVKDSYTFSYPQYKDVVPGTMGEALLMEADRMYYQKYQY